MWPVPLLLIAGILGGDLVLVLRTPTPDALTAEATLRVHGELAAAGYDVRTRERRGPVQVDVMQAAEEGDPLAVVAVVRVADGTGVRQAELWFFDRRSRDVRMHAMDLSGEVPERAPSVLAVRTVELLRAWLAAPPPGAARPVAPPADLSAVTTPASRPPLVFVGGGLAALAGRGGLSGSWHGAATLGVRPWPALTFGATVVGGGSSQLNDATGSAEVRETFVLGELAYRGGARRRVRPSGWLVGGVDDVAGRGFGAPGFEGRSGSLVAAAFGAGVGLAARVAGPVELRLGVRSVWITPRPALTLGRGLGAELGGPTVIAALEVVVWP